MGRGLSGDYLAMATSHYFRIKAVNLEVGAGVWANARYKERPESAVYLRRLPAAGRKR